MIAIDKFLATAKDVLSVPFIVDAAWTEQDTFEVEIDKHGVLTVYMDDPEDQESVEDECQGLLESMDYGDITVSDEYDLNHYVNGSTPFTHMEVTIKVDKGNVNIDTTVRTTIEEFTLYLIAAGMPDDEKENKEPNVIDLT